MLSLKERVLNSDLVNATSNSGVYGKMYKMINSFDPETGSFSWKIPGSQGMHFEDTMPVPILTGLKFLFRNSLQQEHSISISGGSQRSRSYASLSS